MSKPDDSRRGRYKRSSVRSDSRSSDMDSDSYDVDSGSSKSNRNVTEKSTATSDTSDPDSDDDENDDDNTKTKMRSKASECSNKVHIGVMTKIDFEDEDDDGVGKIRTRNKSTSILKSTASQSSNKRRKQKLRKIKICLTYCRYEIVEKVAKEYFNLTETDEEGPWNIFWTDQSIPPEKAMELDVQRWQIVNHFPGMAEICRKDLLSRNLSRMKRLFPSEYDIFPRTWNLPLDLLDLQKYAQNVRNQTYICKPEQGCQGKGIFLIRNVKDLNPFGKIVCQLYVAKPFLIDGYKFDLRVYVLITTIDPLRIYVYRDGLARFATAKYKPPTTKNAENSFMHLTNYSVNKKNSEYVIDDAGGSKRKLSSVYRWFEENGHDQAKVMQRVDDVIIKTIISAHSVLKHNCRACFPNHHTVISACFEILGFDILLDHKLKPYVLEVNHSPSFQTPSELDREVKENLLRDTFSMLNLARLDKAKVEYDSRKVAQDRLFHAQSHSKSKSSGPPTKLKRDNRLKPKIKSQSAIAMLPWELEHCGGFRLVYPSRSREKYDKYMKLNVPTLFQDTANSKLRTLSVRKLSMPLSEKFRERDGEKDKDKARESRSDADPSVVSIPVLVKKKKPKEKVLKSKVRTTESYLDRSKPKIKPSKLKIARKAKSNPIQSSKRSSPSPVSVGTSKSLSKSNSTSNSNSASSQVLVHAKYLNLNSSVNF